MSARVSNLLAGESSDDGTLSSTLPARGGGRNARLATATLGGTLLAYGLRRRSRVGTAASVAGGWLLYRSLGDRVDPERPLEGAREAVRELRDSEMADEPMSVTRSITVGRPTDELYERWRDPETLARVVGPVAEVSDAGEDRLRWSVEGPFGRGLEWETEVVEERPGELLRWESLPGATVPTEGSVRFRPAPRDQGAEVTLGMEFDPPGGALAGAATDGLGFVPDTLVRKALRRFKSLVETGEIPTLEGNPSARGRGDWL